MSKTRNAPMMNKLAEMQQMLYYAVSRTVLAWAESTILQLERECDEKQAQIDNLTEQLHKLS